MPIPQLRRKQLMTTVAAIARRRAHSFRAWFTREHLRAATGWLFLGAILLVVVGAISSAILFAWLSRTLPDPNNIRTRHVAQSTKIFDREGKELLYEIHGEEKRTVVELSVVPQHVQQATIAIEDKKFYEHSGFRITSLVRAVLANALQGRKAQGGSTITQQLVKNAVLTNQKTYARKIKELFLSYEIERRFSKEEILKLYFNEIPYGSNAYGVEAASQTFLGKSVHETDLLEAATLAALPNRPSYYSPYGSHTDSLKNRVYLVLDRMQEEGFISKEEADAAKAQDPLERIVKKTDTFTKAQHFVIMIKEQLAEKYGEEMVEQGGLRVITTLDWQKQQHAEKAVADNFKRVQDAGGSNAALVALDPKTGEILSMVGSHDYNDTEHSGNTNIITRPRQPGSSFKPIVYAASFEKGYTPNTVLYDVDTIFQQGSSPYHPRNYDLNQHGPVTVRTALAGSLNIPAVKMMYLTGVGTVIDFAERLGYGTLTDRSRLGLAIVLGGAEVKPLEHAAAFASFAADGIHRTPHGLLRVEDVDGKILDEWKPEEGTRVMDTEVARNISSIMSDNPARSFIFGARNFLTLPDRPVAAKTGTTNEFRDAWTVGYTPSLATVVWAGNNDNTPMHKGADGSKIAAPIWNQFMRDSLKGTPVETFPAPQAIVTGKPVLDGQTTTELVVKIDRATGMLATENTPASFVEEHHLSTAHTILTYVDKDNPRGAAPEHPEADPEYTGWEAAIQAWAKVNVTSTTQDTFVLPTGTDTVHVPENIPSVSFTTPQNGGSLIERNVTVSVSATAPRGVRRVEYLVDDVLIGVVSSDPWVGNFSLPGSVGVGFHTLEARAYDDVDNRGTTKMQINVTVPGQAGPNIFWAAPSQGAVFQRAQFPITLSASLGDTTNIARLDFVAVSADGSYRSIVGSIENPGTNILLTKWQLAPSSGAYYLHVELQRNDGTTYLSPEQVAVTVQ